jgi:hypothetical protein
MPHDSLRSHALDRRVIRRRGWITPAELERQLAGLPDLSDRVAEPEPEAEKRADALPSRPATP